MEQNARGNAWAEPFIRAVEEFADLGPSLAPTSDAYAELAITSARLRGLIGTLREAPLEGELPAESLELVQLGVERLRGLLRRLRTSSLVGSELQFTDFDEKAFAEKIRALPRDEFVSLYRSVIADPAQLTSFQAVTRASLFQTYGLPAALDITGPIVILFKLVVLLILFLIVIAYPLLIPFALAVVNALVEFDKAGQKAKPLADTPNGGKVISHPGGPTVVIRPDGTVVVVNGDGTTVTVPPTQPQPKPFTLGPSWEQQVIGCVWFTLYRDANKAKGFIINHPGNGSTNDLEIEVDGQVSTLRPPDYTTVHGKHVRLHLKGDKNDVGQIVVTETS
jgi:hypothetical protein